MEVRMRSDAVLLRSADSRAFRELYDRHAERIYRFQLARTRDRDAALELTAETFAQAWLSRTRFRDLADGSAAPWLYGIARHVLLASVRKRQLEQRAVERLGAEIDRHDHETVPSALWLEGLDEAIAELPVEVRRALELRIVDELPLRRRRPRASDHGRRRARPCPSRPQRLAQPLHQHPGGTEMNYPELVDLGDRLERAVAAHGEAALRAPRRRRVPRKLLLAVAAVIVVVPGIALAAGALISDHEVAAGLPAGTRALVGTQPTCTAVRPGVEYHCVLVRTPAPEISDWKGTVEPTVDATKHVNGGCRSARSDGLEWQCYLGQAAVDEKIIGPSFLGQYAPAPGVG
ncbi:MAG: hypothetical protein AUG48_07270 [Actinobacteria bacterium 13_1_20CM_3_68_9]|nr:MAG: hypothetical protein AUG48_07270 [Actinobacteria bacterium 13_1_20CM_3_68_9]